MLLAAPRPPDIPFKVHPIDTGASETAAVADINRDGRLDIVSGEHWYEAPAWTTHTFRELNFTQQYIDDFSDLPIDVDGDGYPDIVSVAWFARRIVWWRNPGKAAGLWKDAEISAGFNIEFAVLADLDNDGKTAEVVAQENGTGQSWYEVRNGAWIKHVVSDRSYGHGIGAGDVNKDGRNDILTPKGWLEAPPDPRSGPWTFHPDWESVNTTDLGFMHVADVNGDGRNDVIAAAAHDYGVFWFEQGVNGQWTRRVIDNAWSQGHASTLADLNGDGQPDLVTGKRFMAHNGADPGEREPLGVYWYEFRNASGGRGVDSARGPSEREARASASGGGAPRAVEWIRHIVDYGGRMGGGMQIPVVDIDSDGDLDLVCAGKSGLFLVENVTKRK